MRVHYIQNATTDCSSTKKRHWFFNTWWSQLKLAKEGQNTLCIFWNENEKLIEKNRNKFWFITAKKKEKTFRLLTELQDSLISSNFRWRRFKKVWQNFVPQISIRFFITCFGITILATQKPTLDNAPPPAPSATPSIAPTSPCHPNPCQNGGTCHDFDAGRNYKCICPVGFEGSHCQGKKL